MSAKSAPPYRVPPRGVRPVVACSCCFACSQQEQRARAIAKRLDDADLAIIDKRRPQANQAEVTNIIGDVRYRTCVLVDDIADTAGTLCSAASALKKEGCRKSSATARTRSCRAPRSTLFLPEVASFRSSLSPCGATGDFRSNPGRFRSHLSILFELFPPEEMAAGRPLRAETTIPLHGLVQEVTTPFHDGTGGTWWRRQPRHGTPLPIDGGEKASILLGELPALISSATATVARSTPDSAARPIIRLELVSDERALINEVHDASDWVFTIDRNMGIEFFDHGGRRDRPDYLIDYTPSTVPEHGHRLIISSRSLAELEAILRPVLEEYGLDTSERHAVVVLDQLRSLSGRLALKLVSGPLGTRLGATSQL